jgi:hypothetical protein
LIELIHVSGNCATVHDGSEDAACVRCLPFKLSIAMNSAGATAPGAEVETTTITTMTAFPTASRARIADLSPENAGIDLSDVYVEAQVVLIWPYSSSTRRFSLLLSEPDRPLNGRKQVKVTLLRGAAKATQKSHVGIGDTVKLSLQGAHWTQNDDVISTPGKRVDADLVYDRGVILDVTRPDGQLQQVRYESTGTPEVAISPALNGVALLSEPPSSINDKMALSQAHTTPARKKFRWSGTSYADSPLDPFAEDREYVYGRSIKRTKFARPSGDWKLVDDTDDADFGAEAEEVATQSPSRAGEPLSIKVQSAPPKSPDPVPPQQVIDLVSPVEEAMPNTATIEPLAVYKDLEEPVPKPSSFVKPVTPARSQRHIFQIDLDDETRSDATSTPRLMPMPSPGLPLVSPLIRQPGIETGYFPAFTNGVSELDASGRPEDPNEGDRRSSADTRRLSDESLVLLDEPSKQVQTSVAPEVIEDEDMYGAPEPSQPFSQPFETASRARDALDVLEEFLQMSPTLPKEMFPAPSGALEEEETAAKEAADGEDDLVVEELHTHEVTGTDEAHEQKPNGEATQSRELSTDGAADEDQLPEHIRMLQNLSNKRKTRQKTPIAATETRDIRVDTDVSAEAADIGGVQLLSPAETQEDQRVIEAAFAPSPGEVATHLPTPDQTQSQPQLPPPDLSSQEAILEEPQPSTLDMSSVPPGKLSQRTLRKSATADLSSPYFTPSRSQAIPSTSAQEKPAARSSHVSQPPGSPTKRVTRSQKATSPPPGEVVDEATEAQSEAVQESEKISRTGTQTSLSYYPPLSSLNEHFGQLIDVIAVAVDDSTKPERAKSGPRDYHNTLRIVDSSLDPTAKIRTSVQIFRPHLKALPVAHRSNIVILRNFKVQTAKHKWMLLSTDSSAWAVFNANPSWTPMSTSLDVFDGVAVSGPPMEYGEGELTNAQKLVEWWDDEGEDAFPAFGSKPSSPISKRRSEVNGHLQISTQVDDAPDADAADAVMESVEPPPVSPRRTRNRSKMAESGAASFDSASARDTASPMSTRQQPARKAKSKTPVPVDGVQGKSRKALSPPQQPNGNRGVSTRTTRSSAQPSTAMESKAGVEGKATRNTRSSVQPTSSTNDETNHKTGSRTTRSSTQPASTSAGATSPEPPRRSQRGNKGWAIGTVVHELRDGITYVDDGREREKAAGLTHELRDGKKFVDVDE